MDSDDAINQIETIQSYEINTAFISSDLQDNWKHFDRNFLLEIDEALYLIHSHNNDSIYSYDGTNGEYLKNYEEVRYPRDLKKVEEENHFPFLDYDLIPDKKDRNYHSIVNLRTSYIVENNHSDFDLFFALKLYQVDIMRIDEFLHYQLLRNFENKKDNYSDFLKKLCLKYKSFLGEKQEILVNDYVKKVFTHNDSVSSKDSNKEFTTSRQVLAIHYLFDELKVYSNTDKTEIARFIQFLTGKETGSSKIKDTTIYKKVKSPLPQSEKGILSDLQFIRIYFEKLGLQGVVNQIIPIINNR